jgi:hypothetical protein
MLIFSRPSVFPEQARRITEEISSLLAETGLSAHKAQLWLEIFVDFIHGAALATAAGGRRVTSEPAEASRYGAALEELLLCLRD